MFLVVLDQSKLLIDESSIGILKDIELIFLLDCECMFLFFFAGSVALPNESLDEVFSLEGAGVERPDGFISLHYFPFPSFLSSLTFEIEAKSDRFFGLSMFFSPF